MLVHLIRNRKCKDFLNLRTIHKIRVQVDTFRPPKKAVQCFNCQLFYHVAAHCHVKPRCAGCGQNHQTKECNIKPQTVEEKANSQATCCNCGESHTANYKGCKAFPKHPQPQKSYSEIVKAKIKFKSKPQTSPKVDSHLPP